jgi:hypothetical protein
MGLLEAFKDILGEQGVDTSKIDIPVSGNSAEALDKLISSGVFKNKSDFTKFLVGTYLKNNVGSKMSGGNALTESVIISIIDRTGIARGLDENTKRMLVPLLAVGFTAIYRYMSGKKTATKPA